jgi:hypothetical protein
MSFDAISSVSYAAGGAEGADRTFFSYVARDVHGGRCAFVRVYWAAGLIHASMR